MSASSTYYNFSELTNRLQELARLAPSRCRMSSLGQTAGGHHIWLMTVTDFSDHDPLARPAVWVDGNTHASELAGCQACVHLIELLTEGQSSRIQELLKSTTFYVVPRISVDGAEQVLAKGAWLRSTPVEFPGYSPQENFVQKDMDGDGQVLSMRIPDPAGLFKVSKADPRLMVTREPDDFSDEQGPFYNLMPEGEFENFDGLQRRFLPRARYDLNRQAPADFSPREYGAGPLPMQLPEAKALAEAVVARPNIAVCVTYHTFGGFLLRPFSGKPDSEFASLDLEVFKTMGEIGAKVTGYRPLSVYHDFKYDPKQVTTGAWDDWHYAHRGVFAWTPEIWSLAEKAGVKVERPLSMYQDLGEDKLVQILRWCDQNLEGDSHFATWKAFEHPQLGRVEIGGWRPLFVWSNPPVAFLADEISRLSEWVLRLAQMLAHVQISQVKLERHGEDVFQIRVALSNRGFLPTYVSQSAQHLKIYPPPIARLELQAGQVLVQGQKEQSISHLEGRCQTLPWISPISGKVDNPNESVVTYTVRGRGCVRFEASFHGGGVVKRDIVLE